MTDPFDVAQRLYGNKRGDSQVASDRSPELTGVRTLRLVSADRIAPERVRFALADRVPLGMVTLLVGQGGLGKSTLLVSLAAGWSRGTVAGDLRGRPVDVVIASSEDHRAAVITPRLIAASANRALVHFIETELGDVPADIELDGEVAELEPVLTASGARVLMIDTLVSHIPGRFDAHKEQHVRRVLAPLAHMAERLGIAIIATMHLNRREARDVLTRISGSAGFGNLARSVLLLAPDPDDPDGETRMLAHAKANVGQRASTLRLRVSAAEVIDEKGEVIPTSCVHLVGEAPHVVAGELLSPVSGGEELSIREDVEECLSQLLAGGRVEAKEARAVAMRETGASSRTVDRAKRRLAVVSEREGFGPGSRLYWRLSPAEPPPPP